MVQCHTLQYSMGDLIQFNYETHNGSLICFVFICTGLNFNLVHFNSSMGSRSFTRIFYCISSFNTKSIIYSLIHESCPSRDQSNLEAETSSDFAGCDVATNRKSSVTWLPSQITLFCSQQNTIAEYTFLRPLRCYNKNQTKLGRRHSYTNLHSWQSTGKTRKWFHNWKSFFQSFLEIFKLFRKFLKSARC